MSHALPALWPWLTIAGLGLFHGINPAMGWLFAVGLGLQQGRRRVVVMSLLPIALGHAAAVMVAMGLALWLGSVLEPVRFARAGGVVLIGWALWHVLRAHRMRPRVGMRAGMAGLAFWSFMMATTHGAGLMLFPVLMPLCVTPVPGAVGGNGVGIGAGGAVAIGPAVAALGLHTASMLLAIAVISLVVYDRVGVGFLRTGWINLDLVWTVALVACGLWLLLA